MLNSEIFAQFETFIEDAADRTLEVQLANKAKAALEIELKLEITKKLDTSNISVVGSTYLSTYPLPADCLMPLDRIYVGSTPRFAIPMAQRELYKGDQSKFYFNLASGTFSLCGNVQTAETITIPYIYKTSAITDPTNYPDSTVIVWPDPPFHMLVPLEMAKMWPTIEGGDKNFAWDDRWGNFYTDLKNQLIDWDHTWKLAVLNSQTPYGNQGGPPSPYAINDLP